MCVCQGQSGKIIGVCGAVCVYAGWCRAGEIVKVLCDRSKFFSVSFLLAALGSVEASSWMAPWGRIVFSDGSVEGGTSGSRIGWYVARRADTWGRTLL